MRKISQEELYKILKEHSDWLKGNGGKRADLRCADLRRADLSGADLSEADLRCADLRYADLRYADLGGADLEGANLGGANLGGANLEGANYNKTTAFFAIQCPEEGSFIAWKKCKNNFIVKLLIPEDAKRSSATTRKCRCDKAVVIAIFDSQGNEVNETVSSRDSNFVYKKGETVKVDDFDEDRWNECSTGIHFFITRREAELYK